VITPVVEISGVSKGYGGLRPLRLQQLSVGAGDHIAILGFDAPAAEVFVNLLTGASLPDSGEVRIFGRATSAIADSADWLATIDRFGIVSERAVLLDQLTVIQNLALPFTLDIEPPADTVRRQSEMLAADVGLPPVTWTRPAADLDAAGRLRVRLGRALALGPHVLLLEHASAGCETSAADAVGRQIRAIGERRRIAIVAATADAGFARAVASRVVTLEAATGRLLERSNFGWFGRRSYPG
jgi:ABC-type transporter Mla maintaining outer membrane lipid asymmetry ATPase subunit MlaF